MRASVDPFGNAVAAAPGVKGAYTKLMHNSIQRHLMRAAKKEGIPVKGSSQWILVMVYLVCALGLARIR